jgi:5-bromo-4-chloroindolyl phosphate hydrolysis protein
MGKKPSIGVQIIFSFLIAGTAGALGYFLSGNLPGLVQWVISGGLSFVGFIFGANLSPKLPGISVGSSYEQLKDQRKANNDLQSQESLKLIQDHRMQLEQLAFKIKHDLVRTSVQQILQAYQFFAQEVQKDPQDARPVKRYLTNYGETTIKLVQRYVELQSLSLEKRTPEEGQFIDRIEIALGELQNAASTQLVRLREQNLMDLDIELTLLEKTIHLDGLHSSKPTQYAELSDNSGSEND